MGKHVCEEEGNKYGYACVLAGFYNQVMLDLTGVLAPIEEVLC